MAVALAVVAVVALVLDGPRAAVYPAVTALLCGTSLYLRARYPETLKHWTRRRIVDTTAFYVLAVALVVGGILLSGPGQLRWTLPATSLVIGAAMAYTFARFVMAEVRSPQAAQRAANERDHSTDRTA